MGETVVLYSLAAILSACVAALGFKISDKSKGGISITKMAEDLYKSSVPGFKVIVGTAAMALDPGAFYAYMQIVNGKTSVPQNLIRWVNQWLNDNGVYNQYSANVPTFKNEQVVTFAGYSIEDLLTMYPTIVGQAVPEQTTYILENWKLKGTDLTNRAIYINSLGRIFVSYDTYQGTEFTVSGDKGNIQQVFPMVIGSLFYREHIYGSVYRVSSYDNMEESFYVPGQSGSYAQVNSVTPLDITDNDTGIEAGENVPGKDVVIPGEGTGTLTNDDIVGWLQSAVGAAVASALGIGTDTIPFVPVSVKNPAITGDITDALDNVIDQVQDIAQAGATDIDTVATGEKYANTSLAPSKPSGNISASSLYTIWNPSQAQLNNLARFLWSTDFVDTIKKILQSPMDALISLALFPVKPPTDGTHNISLGYIDSGVSALRVSDQFMTVQTSGLVVPHKYNSYLDYAPYTSAEIFLPFIGFCPLNINDIMGKSVDVTYNIDLLSGVCTAIVHANSQSLYSYSGNMAMFLPLSAGNWARMLTPIFGMVGGVATLSAGIGGVMGGAPLLASTSMAVRGAESIGNLGGNSVSRSGGISGNAGIMGDYQPFIVVTRPINDKPTTYDTNIGQTYNKSAQLGTLSGFTVIEEAHIEGMNATDAEKQEIERLLKEGVIL